MSPLYQVGRHTGGDRSGRARLAAAFWLAVLVLAFVVIILR